MKHCLDCEVKLHGRTDKKFCDNNCRSHYNNSLHKGRNDALKTINNILRKNDNILRKFDKHGVKELTTNMLNAAGFNFNFFTHQLSSPSGQIYNCCYSYGYLKIEETKFLLTTIHQVVQDK